MENRNTLKIVVFFLIAFLASASFQSCKSQTKEKRNNMKEKFELPLLPPKEKCVTYAIHVNAKTPYELYLDDILIDYSYDDNMNNSTELNPYLLGNGKHKLKIKYLPSTSSSDGLLHPESIFLSKDAKWNIFFVALNKDASDPLGYSNKIDYQNSELNIVPPPGKVPFWEQEWELNIDKLPYKIIGWSESEDLSKIDAKQLELQVLEYYNYLRQLLNEGKVDEYLKLVRKKDMEVAIATYEEDAEWYTSQERKEKLRQLKGCMRPMQNYKMVLFAGGKLAALLISDGEYKSWPALLSTTLSGKTSAWGGMLHKPKGSNTFEIIRK